MEILSVLILSLLFLATGTLVLCFKISRKISIEENSNSGEDILINNPQVYRHWHLDHLLNVEVERAERHKFIFSYVAVDFSVLLKSGRDYEVRKVLYEIIKRSTRIIDFIIKGKKEGYVFLILSEADEKQTRIVIERIRKNITESSLKAKLDEVYFGFVCYPADATAKDLLIEYVFSTMTKIDKKQPVKSYTESLE
ncbi:MAG: hypothetical protein M0R46_08720 [Candidatus Muirbacterium halophilum]|nr:hypothetical protein [Candidatus Muirbacterium halophilum]MCK9475987.1 hypothetical protein [Candidatus Muirbacterium halophilum]